MSSPGLTFVIVIWLASFVGPFESINIELFHSEKGFGHSRDFLLVLFSEHCIHSGGYDLPREAVPVFEPATVFGLWIRRELFQ